MFILPWWLLKHHIPQHGSNHFIPSGQSKETMVIDREEAGTQEQTHVSSEVGNQVSLIISEHFLCHLYRSRIEVQHQSIDHTFPGVTRLTPHDQCCAEPKPERIFAHDKNNFSASSPTKIKWIRTERIPDCLFSTFNVYLELHFNTKSLMYEFFLYMWILLSCLHDSLLSFFMNPVCSRPLPLGGLKASQPKPGGPASSQQQHPEQACFVHEPMSQINMSQKGSQLCRHPWEGDFAWHWLEGPTFQYTMQRAQS